MITTAAIRPCWCGWRRSRRTNCGPCSKRPAGWSRQSLRGGGDGRQGGQEPLAPPRVGKVTVTTGARVPMADIPSPSYTTTVAPARAGPSYEMIIAWVMVAAALAFWLPFVWIVDGGILSAVAGR